LNTSSDMLKASIIKYCTTIGTDPLLVQGAGGNVSWKDGDTLWVKASGTWLADAEDKDIFVPVDLTHLRTAIGNGDFSVSPIVRGETALRPSIETLLHALMPHRVVVHLHAIEILSRLVRENCQTEFLSILAPSIHWAMVDYHKPGASLAAAVCDALTQKPNANVIFLKNHGVVIGGADISEISANLGALTAALSTTPISSSNTLRPILPPIVSQHDQFIPSIKAELHQLALNIDLFSRLDSDWALYPDHVVFLGAKAYTYKTWKAFFAEFKAIADSPELIFIQGCGVFVSPTFSKAKYAQLQCFYDVLVRQHPQSRIKALSIIQIAELLNWDAEKYRQLIST